MVVMVRNIESVLPHVPINIISSLQKYYEFLLSLRSGL